MEKILLIICFLLFIFLIKYYFAFRRIRDNFLTLHLEKREETNKYTTLVEVFLLFLKYFDNIKNGSFKDQEKLFRIFDKLKESDDYEMLFKGINISKESIFYSKNTNLIYIIHSVLENFIKSKDDLYETLLNKESNGYIKIKSLISDFMLLEYNLTSSFLYSTGKKRDFSKAYDIRKLTERTELIINQYKDLQYKNMIIYYQFFLSYIYMLKILQN